MQNSTVGYAVTVTAQVPAILVTLFACTLVAVAVDRWWALLLPVAVLLGVFAAGLSDWFYERVPEDVQAGVALGALGAVLLGGATMVVRRRRPQGKRLKTPSTG